MIFVGSGSLLSQAVLYTVKAGLRVDIVCCPVGDSAIPRLRNSNIFVLESDNPNRDLLTALCDFKDAKIFSINNKHILSDVLLESGHDVFNIHNGIVQRYRGIAEVCIFAAICNGDQEYGATLHKLLPKQKVDSGPVVAQRAFGVNADRDDFATVMKRSLEACRTLFEENVRDVIEGDYTTTCVELSGSAYSYRDISRICAGVEPSKLARASDFGVFRPYFPKLVQLATSPSLISPPTVCSTGL